MTLDDYYFGDPRLFLFPSSISARSGMSREFAALVGRARGLVPGARRALRRRLRALLGAQRGARASHPLPGRRRASATSPSSASRTPYGRTSSSSTPAPGWSTAATSTRSPRTPSSSPTSWRTATGWRSPAKSRSRPCTTRRGGSSATTPSAPPSPRRRRVAPGPMRRPGGRWRDALPWLRRLGHETLAPPLVVEPASRHSRDRPPGAARARGRAAAARGTLDGRRARYARLHQAAWRAARPAAVRDLCGLARRDAPPSLVTGRGGSSGTRRARRPRLGARGAQAGRRRRRACGARRPRGRGERAPGRFLAALVDPAALPTPQPKRSRAATPICTPPPADRLRSPRARDGAPARSVPAVRARRCSGRGRSTNGRTSPSRPAGFRGP